MAKQKKKARPAKKKRPAKKATVKKTPPFPGIGSAMSASAFVIMFRRGTTLHKWEPGDPVSQFLRDQLEQHIPPLTKAERAAIEAKRRLHTELSGSVKDGPADPPPAETRTRRTTAELLGAPTTGVEPVKAGRPDLVGE